MNFTIDCMIDWLIDHLFTIPWDFLKQSVENSHLRRSTVVIAVIVILIAAIVSVVVIRSL